MLPSFSRSVIYAASLLFAVQVSASGRSLESDIRNVLLDKSLTKASVGVAVAELSEGGKPEFLFKSNADTSLMPASNLKLVTSSAAIAILGSDFKFRTELLYKDGDLYLIGDGDPALGDPAVGWTYDQVFKAWADALKRRGITSVRHVYVDDSIFDREFVHPAWPANQLDAWYTAQVSGLSFLTNVVELYVSNKGSAVEVTTVPATSYVKVANTARAGTKNAVGASRNQGTNDINVRGEVPKGAREKFEVTVHDPALYGATVLYETLRSEGIEMTGGVGRNTSARAVRAAQPGMFNLVASLETPLQVVLNRCNKDSQNMYAESLAKRLAAKATGRPGSWADSRVAIGAWLNKLGVPSEQFNLDDGCGLSRNNRISAEGMVRVLASDFGSPYRDMYVGSLAVGGKDGTLKRRFEGTLEERVYAKTGFINGVSSLSGFVRARNGKWYAFSILMNGVSGVKPLQDKIVKAIDDNMK